MTTDTVRTAIFPVAGLGTRFLPATKATPKELLPVIDTPLIQFAIDEARDAGVERMVFVSHPSKSAIERHVRADHDLIATLHARGKSEIAQNLHAAALDEDEHEVEFVMQHEPLGLGHAVLRARSHVLPGPVAVILPDDLILSEPGCLSEMIDAYAASSAGHMVATMEVTPETVSRYGVLDPISQTGPLIHARGMVEKPAPEDAPSMNAVVGRYVLDGAIFDTLASQTPGAGGEIQLTDAIARDAARLGLAGFNFSGRRFDCGSKQGMLEATLAMASRHPDLSDVIASHRAGIALQVAAE
ncbi:UTP--glucose-1-phosphate uridylyltransferase [Rhodovulum adriaticum]|uniref:UTP--glucose-1-phosphate uridylyltransferase n=1 Tax=Rhodovulum adriaticum TaxID=35804 RepID=A0A4R2NN15_RHOAD|nr:UTP--glucose-1-phosphate uridylyltransferase [Rhodovulum adriaticum]MBK1634531.1 UTP--glucose-1-phosphate uridylyltransferase [Rhodovulum adriaticum]TCP23099.1 UTP--glucose-1-phosphate uridylyltransferase [Rhodovulum adriaticum]